ncbi:hypothetical protein TcWFU_008872 [Taenia crassiceps]|uniref:Uncharacterized protein n=1 Tax=Taenia crassiceps TaxID=6207 RepID=A0ABR4QV44_9CEST
MDSLLNVILSYLKCLQYLRLKNPDKLSESQLSQLKSFVVNCSKFPRVRSICFTPFLKHQALFPFLEVANLDPDPSCVESCCSRELTTPKGAPFFADSSQLWLKVQHLPLNAAIEYMDWCWELNPSSFVSVLVEILECDNDLPKDKFVSWIVDALRVDDTVLLEFIKHSRGRLRDICGRNSTFSSAFTTALSRALHEGKFQTGGHCSDLHKYVECFRLACFIPL